MKMWLKKKKRKHYSLLGELQTYPDSLENVGKNFPQN